MAQFRKRKFAYLRRAHIRFGQKGEKLACRLLRNLDMDILHRNYSGPHGEIDIIARDQSIMCFVEVKTRRRSRFSRPADAVTFKKKQNIIKTANRYLRQLGHPSIIYRFDIVEVIFIQKKLTEVRYWPNEFSPSELNQGIYS